MGPRIHPELQPPSGGESRREQQERTPRARRRANNTGSGYCDGIDGSSSACRGGGTNDEGSATMPAPCRVMVVMVVVVQCAYNNYTINNNDKKDFSKNKRTIYEILLYQIMNATKFFITVVFIT